MSAQPARSRTATVGFVVVAVLVINVLPRVVGVPDIELPALSLPDLPEWVDPAADVAHTVLRVKNWLLAGLVVAIVVSAAARRQRSSA